MPLNGRQFANLAVTIPGVGLGYHSDPTKSTQFSPQINGGNGRNVNYQIDGGDNNDDTVGGLLQLFPLEAIQEFNFVTSRSKAEYGRSNGGVMNIVTKSGTNDMHGSLFTMFRDDVDEREDADREATTRSTSRTTAATSTAAASAARSSRTRSTTSAPSSGRSRTPSRSVSTQGLFPDLDGIYATPYRETLADREGHGEPEPEALPVGALRPQPELAALRRQPATRRRTTGATARTRSTRST